MSHPTEATAHPHPTAKGWRSPLSPRDPEESHRAATPLELFFDLCFVVAVAQASAKLHHGLLEGHVAHALMAFALVFFAIWWAWMNFTWLASAYDNDDAPYRLKVFVQIVGVLIISAGIPRAFEHTDFSLVTLGYAVMRLGLLFTWLRAGRADPLRSQSARRYVVGLLLVQSLWVSMLFLPAGAWLWLWPLAVGGELLVPYWAEKATRTPWHPSHIVERYGLLTLIVLGESVLAATVAIQQVVDAGQATWPVASLIVGALLILFASWWLYFEAPPAHAFLAQGREVFFWAYGHAFIFAALAALGAGLGAFTEDLGRSLHAMSPVGMALGVATPCALFLAMVWLLLLRPSPKGKALLPCYALAVPAAIACAWLPWPVLCLGLLMALVAWVQGQLLRRQSA